MLRRHVPMTRILVVDDDPGVRTVVTDALRLDGYEVEAVANGRQALGAMGRQRPAALVLDVARPGTDGPTLMRTLREQTHWGRVPLVVLSGTPGVSMASARLGARAWVHKPFALPDLVAAVERVAPVDQSRSSQIGSPVARVAPSQARASGWPGHVRLSSNMAES
jgi:CheY-like chemotaxis protein